MKVVNGVDAELTGAAERPSTSLRWIRFLLGALGLGLIGYGLFGLPTQLGFPQLLGLVVWMALAVLIHDGLIVPASTAAGFVLTRLGARLSPASAAVMRGALMTGVVISALALLLLKAQSVARITSALEADYALNLLWVWAVILVVSVACIYVIERAAKRGSSRTNTRP